MKTKRRDRRLWAIATAALALLIALFGLGLRATGGDELRLVVLIVVDGLPQQQLAEAERLLGGEGLGRLIRQGAWFTDAHYGYAPTFTAAGHATVATGANPYRHGIVSNDWLDLEGNRLYCTEDRRHRPLEETGSPHAGVSPRNLRSATLGDTLRLATGMRSRALSISLKDRGAILPGGHTGMAYWYSSKTGRFVTSDYYRREYPDWWREFYAQKPQDRWFKEEWKLNVDRSLVPFAVGDGLPWQQDYKGLGVRFPLRLRTSEQAPGPNYYSVLTRTPYGDLYTLEFVQAAVRGERLGKGTSGAPDLLVISFSAHDYVNHAFGANSLPSFDHLVRLDRIMATLLSFLKDWVDSGHVIAALTADHGFAPCPEYLESIGAPTGRLDMGDLIKRLNDHLRSRFGVAPVKAWWNPTLYLDYGAIKKAELEPNKLETDAVEWLRRQEGVAFVYSRAQLERGQIPLTEIGRKVIASWDPVRSGDIFVVGKPYWYVPSEGDITAATHGSPYGYDDHVPLIFWGPGVKPGRYRNRVSVTDLAPTLARLIGINAPADAEGRALSEALE